MRWRTPEETTAPAPRGRSDAEDEAAPADASDYAWLTDEVIAELDALDCTDPANLIGGADRIGDPDAAVVTCDSAATAKYALGPVEITGDMIASAASGLNQTSTGAMTNEWITTIKFDGEGTGLFADVTTRLYELNQADPNDQDPLDQFAIVLDGLVVSAPQVQSVIANGQARDHRLLHPGSRRRRWLVQLNFGALPLTFEVQSEEQISATLGGPSSCSVGLLAGLIGLVLVALYSLAQYRALGLGHVASLVVAAVTATCRSRPCPGCRATG